MADALLVAIKEGQLATANRLLEEGSDSCRKDRHGNVEVVKFLLGKGVDINQQNALGDTALISAVKNGHTRAMNFVLKLGAKVDLKNRFGETALLVAAQNGYKEVVEFLLEKGADINQRDKAGDTVLLVAAKNNHINLVRFLLYAGADIDQAALAWIYKYSGPEIVNLLNKRIESTGEKMVQKMGAVVDSEQAASALTTAPPRDENNPAFTQQCPAKNKRY